MPCSECGGSVARGREEGHVCEEERRLRYQLFQLREEIAAFDARLQEYLDSPKGRFEAWYAARQRARRSGQG
jgi:hypothetical protein